MSASTRYSWLTTPSSTAGSGFHDTPPSVVVYARLGPGPGVTNAIPLSGPLKRMSAGAALPAVALAGVPGIAVCLENDCPASVVRRTEPSASSRKPVFLSMK